MKNLKVNKALLTAGMFLGVTLLGGCSKVDNEPRENTTILEVQVPESNIDFDKEDHIHLYMRIDGQDFVFKECDGYEIRSNFGSNNLLSFIIKKSGSDTAFAYFPDEYAIIYSRDTVLDKFIEDVEVKTHTLTYTKQDWR